MNCSREECQKIIDSHWEEVWKSIRNIDFPERREFPIKDAELFQEFKNLCNLNKDSKGKTNSKLVYKFFPSIITANKGGKLSPAEYWKIIQQDPEEFKKFYANRLMYSDWFNEKQGVNKHFLYEGYVPPFIWAIGCSTGQRAPVVSYFKPTYAKKLIQEHLNNYDTIFDPFCGYGGRLLGSVALGKNYIGYDINDITINENKTLVNWIETYFPKHKGKAIVKVQDSFVSTGEFECLFTCPPYSHSEVKNIQIEEWLSSSGKISCKYTCDQIIDLMLKNFTCRRYVFVVDDSIQKYRKFIVNKNMNVNYINARNGELTEASKNFEAIVVIDKVDRDRLISNA